MDDPLENQSHSAAAEQTGSDVLRELYSERPEQETGNQKVTF